MEVPIVVVMDYDIFRTVRHLVAAVCQQEESQDDEVVAGVVDQSDHLRYEEEYQEQPFVRVFLLEAACIDIDFVCNIGDHTECAA